MKFKKLVGIIQLVGGIALSLTTFLVWEFAKKGFTQIEEKSRTYMTEGLAYVPLIGDITTNILLFLFIIILIISLLFILQGVVNIKE